jgi:DHA3 family macrolide efflux protein-like MFS transporter
LKNLSAIILLFIANSISGISQGISMIAIPWYFAMQDEMTTFGIIYILTNVLGFFWVPYGGTLVDKYNRKHIFMFITVISGLLLAGVSAWGFHQEGLHLWLVGFVFMFTFSNYNIHYPNLYAFVQEISEKEKYGSISSYIEIQGQSTNILAGAGAALLLEGSSDGIFNLLGFSVSTDWEFEAWQIHEIFALDAGTYALGFIFIALIKYTPLAPRRIETGPILERLKTGMRYLTNNLKILVFGMGSHSVFAASIITTMFLAPIYVKNHLMESGDIYASGKMYFAIGSVLSGIAIRQIFKRINIPLSIIILTSVAIVAYAVLSINTVDILFYLMSFMLGMANAGIRVQRVTYLFMHIPNQVYGRATSIFTQINTLFRILFLSLFSLAFFQKGHEIIYAFAILSLFLILTIGVLIKNYKTLDVDRKNSI